MANNIEKTEEMKRYEEETGKFAIWRGNITESFKKWKKGEKIYDKNKERVSLYVSEKKKAQWQKFAVNNDISTISKLVRESVDSYMERRSKVGPRGKKKC